MIWFSRCVVLIKHLMFLLQLLLKQSTKTIPAVRVGAASSVATGAQEHMLGTIRERGRDVTPHGQLPW